MNYNFYEDNLLEKMIFWEISLKIKKDTSIPSIYHYNSLAYRRNLIIFFIIRRLVMQIYLILAAIIAISIIIFSFQNPFPLMVYFLNWEVKSSLAIILIITFIAGILTSFLVTTISRIKRMQLIARQKKTIAELTKKK